MKGVLTGIKSNPFRAITYWITAFSVLWTLVEGFTYFIPSIDFSGVTSLVVIAISGIVFAFIKISRPPMIEIPIHHTNTRIEIKFGDLFKEDGYRVIAVSEFFESEIGIPVSDKSLHGIFLSKCFGGHSQTFDQIIEKELKDFPSQNVTKSHGKTLKYPIGTTAIVPVNNDHYLCCALTETEIDSCKVNSDVPTLWNGLCGLWSIARVSLGGSALVLPLVGSGLSGIGLPPKDLLNLIILSVITETKRKQIAACIRIILTDDLFDEVDLGEVRRHWR